MPPGSSIIALTSLAAHDGGGPGAAHYAAAKGGVLTYVRSLAKELAPGIRVNGIAPGMINTQFHDRFTAPEVRSAVAGRTLLQREGKASEVADACLFLASPMASFITGEILEINGGLGTF
jgi:3-oxoacyl-[acyl-carrier protein] reductase